MMQQPLSPDHPLRRLFAGSVQHALFVDVGICDTQLADYLSEMLSNLIHVNEIYPFQDATGRRLVSLAEWLTDAQLRERVSSKQRQRIVHKHIGDFSLFWTGLFPEGLKRLEFSGAGDRITDFLQQGKRSYSIASELTSDNEDPPATVLHRLSEQFEFCMHGLNICRRGWSGLGLPPASA
jgi:hypothetical protein